MYETPDGSGEVEGEGGAQLGEGGGGIDTADLRLRAEDQQITITGRGAGASFNTTGGTAAAGGSTRLVTGGFVNIDVLLGGSTNIDTLTGVANRPGNWTVKRNADANDAFDIGDGVGVLEFEHFEQLVGQDRADARSFDIRQTTGSDRVGDRDRRSVQEGIPGGKALLQRREGAFGVHIGCVLGKYRGDEFVDRGESAGPARFAVRVPQALDDCDGVR